MDPTDFISLAVKLSNSRQEAELRTAVSRAYYGALHAARELLEQCGVGFPPKELFGADVHRKVRFCLANANDADAALFANKLSDLRSQRNNADYDLKTERFSLAHAKNVSARTQLAIEIVDALQRCQSEPRFGGFQEKVRAYARDVLRLPVQHE
jgi:uncharacterized protein (UPF0332 family)